MAANQVDYEWVIEFLEGDEDDIVDHIRSDNPKEILREYYQCLSNNGRVDLTLIRDEGNDGCGLLDRQYAYIKDLVLPDQFDGDFYGENGAPMPKYIKKQWERAVKQV